MMDKKHCSTRKMRVPNTIIRFPKKPTRLSIEGYGSVPVDRFLSALKDINMNPAQKSNHGKNEVSDDDQDDGEYMQTDRRCRPDRRSQSGRERQKSVAPSQMEEVSTVDANLALVDPMYHDQARDIRKGVWSRRMGMSKPGVKILVRRTESSEDLWTIAITA